jgi:hypothetical protein
MAIPIQPESSMPVRLRCAALLLPGALLCAADPVPAVSFVMPDASRTARTLADGGGGRLAALPAVADLRRHLEGGPSGAAWSGLGRLGTSVRGELRVGPVTGGVPAIELLLAMMLAPGRDPAPLPGLRSERQGAWLLAGRMDGDLSIPERLPIEAAQKPVDVAIRCETEAAAPVLGAWAALPAAAGCRTMQLIAGLVPGGTREELTLAGDLPLRAVDLAVLAGMPADAVAVVAIGSQGQALAGRAERMVAAAGVMPAVVEAACGVPLAELAGDLDGSIGFALLADGFALNLPAAPMLDALLAHLIRAECFDRADEVIAESRTHAVSLAGIARVPVHLRRTETRWLLGSSSAVIDGMAGEQPTPFPAERLGAVPEGAVLVAAWHGSGLAAWTAGVIPPASAGARLQAVLRAVAPHLPDGALAGVPVAGGVQCAVRNGPGLIALDALALAEAGIPALVEAWRAAGRVEAEARMRAVIARATAFAKEQSGHWPRDLADLRSWAREMADDQFAAPGRPGIGMPWCYVPPVVGADADQPILVQDPACNDGDGSLVGYRDGRLEMRPGRALWQEARRLAELARSEQRGIERADWTLLPKTF